MTPVEDASRRVPVGAVVIVNGAAPDEVPLSVVESAVRAVLEGEGAEQGEVSLTLLDDAGITELNREYLGRHRPTDVIAFPLGREPLLGDVYVGLDEARRQAEDLGVPLREELVRLAVHGTLHVLGHDHPEGEDRWGSPMYRLQERYVQGILDRAGRETR